MKTASIKKNYLLNTAYQLLALIAPLITAPYISRVLGVDGVGIYSYTSSIAAVFALFAVLGTTSYGQRAIAQSRDDRESLSINFWEIAMLCLITTFVCTIVWIAFVFIKHDVYTVYYLILTFTIIGAGINITWFYAGMENFSVIVFRNFVVKIASIICLFCFVKNENDLIVYTAILSVSNFLGYVTMWFSVRRYVDFVPLKRLNILPHLKNTIAYFIPTIAASVYTYLDKAMIGIITDSNAQNGYYEQSQKIVMMAYTVVTSINMVMTSRISYLFSKDNKKEIEERLEAGFAFILTLSVPMAFGIAGISANFVPWFFGRGYEAVVLLLILRAPLVVILSLHNYYADQYLVPSGQRVRSTKGVILGAAVNFIFNLMLIPRLASVGAVIATIISELTICIVYAFMSKEYVSPKWYIKYMPKRLISGGVMLVIINMMAKGKTGSIIVTMLQVITGAIIYFAVLVILRDEYTVIFIREYVRKLKNRLHK